MKFLASKTIVGKLYQGNAKVLLCEGAFDGKDETFGEVLDVYHLIKGEDDSGPLVHIVSALLDENYEGEDVLTSPPVNVWSIFIGDDDELADWCKNWWKETGSPYDTPDFIKGNQPDLVSAVIDKALNSLQAAQERNFETQMLLVELRKTNERLREKLGEITRTFDIPNNAPLKNAYSALPSEKLYNVKDKAVIQPVPGNTHGLTGIDIHLAADSPDINAILTAKLYAKEDGSVLGSWNIPVSTLSAGWVSLWLPEALVDEYHYAMLELKLNGTVSDGLMLSTAKYSFIKNHLLLEGDDAANTMLALRQWRGVPGVTYNHSAFAHLVDDGSENYLEYILPDSKLSLVEPLQELDAQFPYFHKGAKRFRLHPVRWEITSAVMRGVIPYGTMMVSGNVIIEDKKCEVPIKARLILAKGGIKLDDIEDSEKVFADSGWSLVHPDSRKHTISLTTNNPVDVHDAELVILTQAADQRPPSHALSIFDEFKIGLSLPYVLGS